MKKISLLFIVLTFCIFHLLAIVARPKVSLYTQPNGYSLQNILKGDEFFHYRVSVDNFVLLSNADGYLTYAESDSTGVLVSSGIIAHNVNERTEKELKFLKTIQPNLAFGPKVRSRARNIKMQKGMRKISSSIKKSSSVTTTKYLVILVNFSDKSFSVPTPKQRYTEQFSAENYTTDGATGSVREYFKDNSMSNFEPEFDVFGPVTLSKTLAYYGANDADGNDLHPDEMVFDACQKLDGEINFADYDLDNDGVVDNVYVIFAGYTEAGGAAEDTIWPHAWEVSNTTKLDGKTISSYSCSNELQGTSGVLIDGIGTACHEFSHSIGLPDFYDTDYETNGQSVDIDSWSLMASGCYNNNSLTPPFYTGIEREILGWGTATELTTPSNCTLNSIGNNQYCKITTKTPGEFYILENRQQTSWDTFLYHHGMLIYHIDTSDGYISRWYDNTINAYSNHQCADLVEADGVAVSYNGSNEAAWLSSLKGDVFPGTSNITSFTDTTTPSSKSWNNATTEKPVTDITENDGVISFKFMGGESIFGDYKALDATDVTTNSFTANWNAGVNATKYFLNVYTKSDSGSALTAINQGFDNFPTTTPVGFTVSGSTIYDTSGNYGKESPSVKLDDTNESIVTNITPDAIKALSFWLKGNGTNATSSLLVEGSTDKSSWATIATLTNLPTTGTTKSYTLDAEKNYRALRFTYTKSAGNLAVDDIELTYGQEIVKTYLLQNHEVLENNSYQLTGLDNSKTYYYTVKAANETETSAESNEIQVDWTSTSSNNIQNDDFMLYVIGSEIVINTLSDDRLCIYNSLGQLLFNEMISKGITKVPVNINQLYIVKMGNEVRKIICR